MYRLHTTHPSAAAAMPRWIDVGSSEEQLLAARGWGFLSPEEDPPFDLDAATTSSDYAPLWGTGAGAGDEGPAVSRLGWSLTRMTRAEVMAAAARLGPESRAVLLDGRTESPGRRRTSDGTDARGGAGLRGTFFCPVRTSAPCRAKLD
jgi:hypothetical protein